MSRITIVAKGIKKESKADFLVWLDRNLGDFEKRELNSDSLLITTENVNCAKSLCKKKNIRVGASNINFSSASIQSHDMKGVSAKANDEESETSLATSSYDFREEGSSEKENDAGSVQNTRVDMTENFEIPSIKFLLLKKHNFLESLKDKNLAGTCRIIKNHIELSGSQETINNYKIQIYDWLMKTSEVHIEVQKIPKLMSLSPQMLKSINKSLKFCHVLKCNNHIPESSNECLVLIFYDSTKKDAFDSFMRIMDMYLCKWSVEVQQKVMQYLQKELNPKIEDIFKKYGDLELHKENIGSAITKWTLSYFGNKDYFDKATKEFCDLVHSVKVKTFTLERSLSSPTLQTYISGVMNEDHVHIHSYNVLGTVNQENYEERAMIKGMVVSITKGVPADQHVDATFNSSFHSERINISIKHNTQNKYVCFANGFLNKAILEESFDLLCEEMLPNSTLNDEELHKNIKVKQLLNYVMDKAEEENIKSMAVTTSGFGKSHLFFETCEMFSKRFKKIKLFSTDDKEVQVFQNKLRALVSNQESPWTRAESLEFQVIGPDEERIQAAEKKLTNFFA